MLRTDRADAGFTLIEALAALAVVAISIGAIADAMGVAARGTRQLESHVALVQAAANALWSGLPARTDSIPQELSAETAHHLWRADFDQVNIPLAAEGDAKWTPVKVTLRVTSSSGASFQIETVRLFKRPEK